MWKPITRENLEKLIIQSTSKMAKEQSVIWKISKIIPEKWSQEPWGKEGGGFWVVALIGKNCLFYNDIEGGFNWGCFSQYGKIDDYHSDQDEIAVAIQKLMSTR